MASEETAAKRAQRDTAKVEHLADAFENLALGIASKMMAKPEPSAMMEKFVVDARAEVRNALREFMMPNLCLVENPRQPYPADVPSVERVTCSSCKKNIACKPNCFFWHKALRDTIAPAPTEPTPPEPRTPRPPRAA